MNNLKAHNSLKKHINTLQKITAENEILKHIISNLQNENYKLKETLIIQKNKKILSHLSNKSNKNDIANFFNNNNNNNNYNYNNNNNNNNNYYNNSNVEYNIENNSNFNRRKLKNVIEENNNVINIENFDENNNDDEINKKYKNNVKQFLNKYNVVEGLDNKEDKVEVPKLLFILYKKKSI